MHSLSRGLQFPDMLIVRTLEYFCLSVLNELVVVHSAAEQAQELDSTMTKLKSERDRLLAQVKVNLFLFLTSIKYSISLMH